MDERIIQFRVGVLVVATCIITAILVVLFGELPTLVRDQYSLIVLFDEAPGVTVDTPIRKSGILIGRVSAVTLKEDGGVQVTLRIDAKRTVRKNEVCRISPGNVLLGDTALEFVPSGVRGASTEPFVDGACMRGEVAPSPLDIVNVVVDVARVVENLEGDVSMAARSIQVAGNELSVVARNLNTIVANNQDQFQRLLRKSELAMDQFGGAMSALDEFVSDDELRGRLKQSLGQIPDLLGDARQTLNAIESMAIRAERNIEYLEGFTIPLGERGGDLVETIDGSIQRLDELMIQLVQFGESINNQEGSLGQFLNNPDLYQRLNRAAANIEDVSSRLRPIVEDARIFTDKIARDPGRLTSGILSSRQSGIKWSRKNW